ncbi:MAG: DUF1097 family protein [Actinomycetota bacterium]
MGARAKAIFPLALVIGVLSFLWTEFSLNFTFQWVTDGDLGIGLNLPSNFHLILPTAFIAWGLFFAAGGDNAAFGKVFLAAVFGTVAALVTMPLSFKTADLDAAGKEAPFWGIALWVGIFAFVLVMILVAGDWYYVAGTFPCFASVFLWWIATGLDGWAPNGGGVGNSIEALGSPGTAGAGAFGGVLSTPWGWVWFNTFLSLVCGCVLGILSAKLAAALTPKPKAAAEAA